MTVSVYGSYLVFQLWSHATLYDDKHENNFRSTRYDPALHAQLRYMRRTILRRRTQAPAQDLEKNDTNSPVAHGNDAAMPNSNATGTVSDGTTVAAEHHEEEEEEEEQPSMSFPMCIGLLAVVTVVSLSHQPRCQT